MNGRGALAVLLGIICALIVGAAFGRANVPDAELYPRSGVVTGIDRDSDTVEWTDASGHVWAFAGCEDWMVGDGVAAIMDDMGTDAITDDAIVSVRYAG